MVEIGARAFGGCENLMEIQIPEKVEEIGSRAFENCTALKTIVIPKAVTEIKSSTFNNCTALETVTLAGAVTAIREYAFYGCAIADLEWLPYTVTEIGKNAFRECTALTSANLPDGLTTLSDYMFTGCTALTSFTAGADLQKIGNYAFQDCEALTDVKLNDGLTTIGYYAFQNCSALETIVLPDSITSIGTYVFQKNTKLADVTLSKGLTTIPSYAFANCTSLTELVIPHGVTAIKDHAFYQNTKLKTFTIPASVTSIGDNAFSYATTTTIYGIAGSYAETYAKWKSFVDTLEPATAVQLANGTDAMILGRYQKMTPKFILSPENSNDYVVLLVSEDTGIVSVENSMTLYGKKLGTTTVTATTYSGLTYTFTVTVDELVGIEVAGKPNKSVYELREEKDLTGLVVNAVFASGSKERIYNYTVTGFTTDVEGIHTVTVKYNNKYTATFNIICGEVPTLATPVLTGSGSDGKVVLSWTAVVDAENYEIWRANASNGEYTKLGITAEATYTDETAEAGKTYYYKARAMAGEIQSEYSEAISVTCIPATPTLTATTNAETGKPTLTWTAVAGATGYEVWRGDAENADFARLGITAEMTYTDETAEAGKTYYYKVRAVAGEVQGEFSAVVSVACVEVEEEELLNGLNKDSDGVWRYYEDGEVDTGFTGFVKHINGKYYWVYKGVVEKSTGLVLHVNGRWYYIKNGVKTDYVGFVKHTDGNYYYVKDGVKIEGSGFLKHTNGKYYYVQCGMMVPTTGLVIHTNGKYYYIVKGVKQDDFTGLVKHTDGEYYYVAKGMMRDDFTGLAKHTNRKFYYVENGMWRKVTALVPHTNGKLYYVKDGIHDKTFNGKAKTLDGKEYKVVNGIAQP